MGNLLQTFLNLFSRKEIEKKNLDATVKNKNFLIVAKTIGVDNTLVKGIFKPKRELKAIDAYNFLGNYSTKKEIDAQINLINEILEQNQIYELFQHYYYVTCNSCGGPPGWEAKNTIYLQELVDFPGTTHPNNILVNYEWEDESSVLWTWCCCFTYSPNKDKMLPANQNPDLTSVVIEEECVGTPCEECAAQDFCEIELPPPANVVSFTTTSDPSGFVNSITTTESYGNGWEGMVMSIVNVSTGNVEATYTGPPPGQGSQTEPNLTLLPSTEYGIYINTKGSYDQDNGIVIEQDVTNLLTIAPFNPSLTASCSFYTE